MNLPEIVLTESASLRKDYTDTSVLDRVGVVPTLPDDVHLTTDLVANFYEVDVEVIKWHVKNHRSELTDNGLRMLSGSEVSELRDSFARESDSLANPIDPKTRSLTLFTRRTLLNIGMLLRDSSVAKDVRTYLLEVEEAAPVEDREAAVLRALEKKNYKVVIRDCIAGFSSKPEYSFGQIRNGFLRAVSGMDKDELISSGRPIQTWTGKNGPTKRDLGTGTNYLFAPEMENFNLLVDQAAIEVRLYKPKSMRELSRACSIAYKHLGFDDGNK